MKKLLLMIVWALFSVSAYCQQLTLSEMIEKTKCKTFTCFNNFATKKGFTLSKTDTAWGMHYFYSSDDYADSIPDGTLFKTECQLFIYGGVLKGKTEAVFVTASKKYYLPILKELEKKGFKLIEEKQSIYVDGTDAIYKSDLLKEITVTITIYTEWLSLTEKNYTHYHICVSRAEKG